MITSHSQKKENRRGRFFATLVAFATPRQPRRRRTVVADPQLHQVDREMVAAFARLEGADGTVPSKGIYKIRAGEQHPWRVLWRRLREASTKRSDPSAVLAVIRTFEKNVQTHLLNEKGGTPPA